MTAPRGLSNWGAANTSDPRLVVGYKVLRRTVDALGARRAGWKIGANDPATQRRLGLNGPVIGPLGAPSDAATPIDLSNARLPGIEAEIAILIVQDVLPDADAAETGPCIAAVATAAELIDLDQRFDDLELLVGRNFLHRRYYVAVTEAPVAPDALADAILTASLNQSVVWQIPVALVLGDPCEIVVCAARNAALLGERVRAGDVLLSGVVAPLPIWVEPADAVRLDGGVLGALDLRFTGASE
jgi:2-keto-4-pentenoate hydratase